MHAGQAELAGKGGSRAAIPEKSGSPTPWGAGREWPGTRKQVVDNLCEPVTGSPSLDSTRVGIPRFIVSFSFSIDVLSLVNLGQFPASTRLAPVRIAY